MDELMDLLSYECPFTGKRRIAGCDEHGQLFRKHLNFQLVTPLFFFWGGVG